MVSEWRIVLLLLFVLGQCVGQARNPVAVCRNLDLGLPGTSRPVEHAPYSLKVEKVPRKTLLRVTISGRIYIDKFVLQARDKDDRITGRFLGGNAANKFSYLNCRKLTRSAVYNVDKVGLRELSFVWSPGRGSSFKGEIHFKASVSHSSKNFWSDLTSDPIVFDSTGVHIISLSKLLSTEESPSGNTYTPEDTTKRQEDNRNPSIIGNKLALPFGARRGPKSFFKDGFLSEWESEIPKKDETFSNVDKEIEAAPSSSLYTLAKPAFFNKQHEEEEIPTTTFSVQDDDLHDRVLKEILRRQRLDPDKERKSRASAGTANTVQLLGETPHYIEKKLPDPIHTPQSKLRWSSLNLPRPKNLFYENYFRSGKTIEKQVNDVNKNQKQVVHEETAREDAAHEETVNEENVHEEADHKEADHEQTAQEENDHKETAHEETADEETADKKTVDEETANEEAADEKTEHEKAADEETADEGIAHEKTAHKENTHEEVAHEETTDEETANEETAHGEIARGKTDHEKTIEAENYIYKENPHNELPNSQVEQSKAGVKKINNEHKRENNVKEAVQNIDHDENKKTGEIKELKNVQITQKNKGEQIRKDNQNKEEVLEKQQIDTIDKRENRREERRTEQEEHGIEHEEWTTKNVKPEEKETEGEEEEDEEGGEEEEEDDDEEEEESEEGGSSSSEEGGGIMFYYPFLRHTGRLDYGSSSEEHNGQSLFSKFFPLSLLKSLPSRLNYNNNADQELDTTKMYNDKGQNSYNAHQQSASNRKRNAYAATKKKEAMKHFFDFWTSYLNFQENLKDFYISMSETAHENQTDSNSTLEHDVTAGEQQPDPFSGRLVNPYLENQNKEVPAESTTTGQYYYRHNYDSGRESMWKWRDDGAKQTTFNVYPNH